MSLPSTHLYKSRIDEDAIKKAFIPFLKSFYKNRYEFKPGSFESDVDQVSGKGLVADGILQFTKSDGSVFTATFEATSLEKAGEVKYSLNSVYFLWDCLAFCTLTTALVYGWLYVTRLEWVASLHLTGNLGLLLGIATFGFFTWYYLLRNWKKYRYIYAIEQFKRYFANEQWIALGEDVFPATNDPYLEELKKQCVYNGFGLALVSLDGGVRSLSSPSRLGIYGRDRKMVEWFTQNQIYKSMAQNVAAANKMRPEMPSEFKVLTNRIWRPVNEYAWKPIKGFIWKFMKDPISDGNETYERYMRGRSVQQWILAFGFLIIMLLGYRVLQYSPVNYIDPESLFDRERGPNPEDQPGYIIDGEPEPYGPGGIPKQYPNNSPAEEDDDIPVIIISEDE